MWAVGRAVTIRASPSHIEHTEEPQVTKIATGIAGGLVLLAAAALTSAPTKPGYAEIPDGRGGTNVEAALYTPEMGFDKARSLKAFQETLYPLLRANCSGCHSTE